MINPVYNEEKMTVEYRDKMLIERGNILNNYASKTSNKGHMYYIYGKNSKMEAGYNLCICEKGKSHAVIEVAEKDLPIGAGIGSVLRKSFFGNKYVIDEKATKEMEKEINNMKETLLNEQTKYLESKRIEGHIYEISEKNSDRVWLFDVTSKTSEAVEEIGFSSELLNDCKEGDLYIYENGEYRKYSK